MTHRRSAPRALHRHTFPACLALGLLLVGCASPKVDTQWADPQFTGTSLSGARVLVACAAYDLNIKQRCEQQMGAMLTERGATPVLGAFAAAPSADDVQAQARAANATAALSLQIGHAESIGPSTGVSIGLGGFGIGGGSTRAGVGVGMSVPIGGGASGHSARGSVIDAASGRPMWTFRVTASPSADLDRQMAELAQQIGNAAQQAGLLP